jgi:hypothetical protein
MLALLGRVDGGVQIDAAVLTARVLPYRRHRDHSKQGRGIVLGSGCAEEERRAGRSQAARRTTVTL